ELSGLADIRVNHSCGAGACRAGHDSDIVAIRLDVAVHRRSLTDVTGIEFAGENRSDDVRPRVEHLRVDCHLPSQFLCEHPVIQADDWDGVGYVGEIAEA